METIFCFSPKECGTIEWIAVGLGCLSILTVLLWCALLPRPDRRFSSGYKDNAVVPGCGLPIAAIVMGTASYFIDKDVFFGTIFYLVESVWTGMTS